MALSMIHRHIPVARRPYGYFDHVMEQMRREMSTEMSSMDEEMDRIRKRTLTLNPQDSISSSSALQLGSDRIFDRGNSGKELNIEFDVTKFKPEEIDVVAKDNRLMVHAKHKEEKREGNSYSCIEREFSNQYELPQGSNFEAMHAELHKDGILTVKAPMQRIAIKHN